MNALITTPEDLEMRVHLRNEFLLAGFKALQSKLKESQNEEISFQLNVFEDEAADDWQELLHRFHGIQVDMQDELEIFNFVQAIVTDTPAAPYFKSILQHFLLIRDDEVMR